MFAEKFPNGEYEDIKHFEVVALRVRMYRGTAQAILVANLMCLINRGTSKVNNSSPAADQKEFPVSSTRVIDKEKASMWK